MFDRQSQFVLGQITYIYNLVKFQLDLNVTTLESMVWGLKEKVNKIVNVYVVLNGHSSNVSTWTSIFIFCVK